MGINSAETEIYSNPVTQERNADNAPRNCDSQPGFSLDALVLKSSVSFRWKQVLPLEVCG